MPEKLTTNAKRLRPFILGYMEDVVASNVFNADILGELNKIIYFPIVGKAILYDKTAANLTTALAGCAAGEWVTIFGPCTLTGDFTIPASAELRAHDRHQVIIDGTITMNSASLIKYLTISKTANDATTIYGILNSQTGTSYIDECDITVTQSGAGDAYGVAAINGLSAGDGGVNIKRSLINGVSVSGSGYGIQSTRGIVKVWHSIVYGSTARYILT